MNLIKPQDTMSTYKNQFYFDFLAVNMQELAFKIQYYYNHLI